MAGGPPWPSGHIVYGALQVAARVSWGDQSLTSRRPCGPATQRGRSSQLSVTWIRRPERTQGRVGLPTPLKIEQGFRVTDELEKWLRGTDVSSS